MKAIIRRSTALLSLIIFGVSLLIFYSCAVPVLQLQGISGHVAWRVEEVRLHDDHQKNTRTWYYTLILRDTKGVGTTFQQADSRMEIGGEELAANREKIIFRLEPFSELRATLSTGFGVRMWNSGFLASESLVVTRILSGTTDRGESIKVTVSYSFDSSAPKITAAPAPATAMAHLQQGLSLLNQGVTAQVDSQQDFCGAVGTGMTCAADRR